MSPSAFDERFVFFEEPLGSVEDCMGETITCPSGLMGTLRGMRVREETILTDKKLARSGGQLDELLAICWEETADPGPYVFEGKKVDWGLVLQGDRLYALLRLRALTYGPEYAFSVACSEPRCRKRIEWEVSLLDLPVKRFSEESRARFVGGNRFPVTLPDANRKAWFKLLTGHDERRLPSLERQAPGRALSARLAFRLVEIEGVVAEDKRKFVEELSLGDAADLADEFERVDCGVETGFQIECPDCFAVQDVELPFDQGFFMPSKKKRTADSSRG